MNATDSRPVGIQIFAQITKARRGTLCVCRGIAGRDYRWSRERVQVGDTSSLLGPLIVAEEEEFVLDDGATDRTTKLFPIRCGERDAGLVRKRIPCLLVTVAIVVEAAAVELV